MTDYMIIILSVSSMVGIGLITIAIKWIFDSIDNLTGKVDELVDEVRTIECDLDSIEWDISHKDDQYKWKETK